MASHDFDRRRFHELSAAAMSGLLAGTFSGCSESPAPTGAKPSAPKTTTAEVASNASGDKHLCRGLNECKGQGATGKNDCRGQGDCATLAAHDCGTHNECKGQGGCGENTGLNECKGQGGCHVPLMDFAWKTVRTRLEKKWQEAKSPFGDAPAKKG